MGARRQAVRREGELIGKTETRKEELEELRAAGVTQPATQAA
jgi:hypothetical protein